MPSSKKLLPVFLILFLCAAGLGQEKKRLNEDANIRSVEGTVTDAGGRAVTAAVVQLKDTKTLQVRSFITREDGKYHFAGLSANVDYELKADQGGASSGAKTLSLFNTSKTAVINLKLK